MAKKMAIKRVKIQIEVPYAKRFGDYHEIDHHVDDINELVPSRKIKAVEVAFDAPDYIGLFYVGRRPLLAEIKKIVARDCGPADECDYNWRERLR